IAGEGRGRCGGVNRRKIRKMVFFVGRQCVRAVARLQRLRATSLAQVDGRNSFFKPWCHWDFTAPVLSTKTKKVSVVKGLERSGMPRLLAALRSGSSANAETKIIFVPGDCSFKPSASSVPST